MKDYREVADDVFRRSEKIIADNRRRKNKIMKAGSMTVCFCLIALLGVGVWQSGVLSNMAPGRVGNVAMDNVSNTADIKSNEATEGNSHSNVVNNEEKPSATTFGDEDGANGQIIMGGMSDTEFGFEYHYSTMISSYDDGNAVEACYAVPEKGSFGFSIPLRAALDEYGDADENGDILYRVVVDVFEDESMLSANSGAIREEGDRLFESGYTVAMETYNDGQKDHSYFTLHATKEQLINFAVNEKYGYMFFLYDERIPE